MAVLAAKYTPLAAALARASLTARQYDTYRLAIISALATEMAVSKGWLVPVPATSTLGKNVAFAAAHHEALRSIAMWFTP